MPLAGVLAFAIAAGCAAKRPEPTPLPAPAPTPPPPAVTASAAKPAPAPPVSSASSFGTAHPIALGAFAPDGRWAVVCQARADTNADGRVAVDVGPRGELAGDRLDAYLVTDGGPGEAIDELLASDPAGRFVAFVRAGRPMVLDSDSHKSIDLTDDGVDLRRDGASYRPHRSFSFHGSRLLYLTRKNGKPLGVLRDLASGTTRTIDPGPGEVFRVELTSAGPAFHVVAEDGNQDGRLRPPSPLKDAPMPACQAPVPSFAAWPEPEDRPSVNLALGDATAAHPAPGFVFALGDGYVAREPGNRLVLVRGTTRGELARAQCGARVLHADAARQVLVIACTAARGRSPVELVGVGYRLDLAISVEPRSVDHGAPQDSRLVALYPGAGTVLLDLDRRELHTLEPGDAILAIDGLRALLRRGRELRFYDAATRTLSAAVGTVAQLADVLREPPIVFITPLVVDVARAAVARELDPAERPLAVTSDGRVLTAAQPAAERALAIGPLKLGLPGRAMDGG